MLISHALLALCSAAVLVFPDGIEYNGRSVSRHDLIDNLGVNFSM